MKYAVATDYLTTFNHFSSPGVQDISLEPTGNLQPGVEILSQLKRGSNFIDLAKSGIFSFNSSVKLVLDFLQDVSGHFSLCPVDAKANFFACEDYDPEPFNLYRPSTILKRAGPDRLCYPLQIPSERPDF